MRACCRRVVFSVLITNKPPRRQPGQGGDADREVRDLRAELLAAEAAHFSKTKNGGALPEPVESDDGASAAVVNPAKRPLELTAHADGEEDPEAKRRRILQETRDIDADEEDEENEEDDDDDDDDDDSDDDSEDEDAELARQLAKIKRERAEKLQKEEAEHAAAEQEAKERDIALGNPLLNKQDFNMKRRWNDDVVFKNQARGTDEKGKKKEFVNVRSTPPPVAVRPRGLPAYREADALQDLLRSDFHKRFMGKYVR